MARTVVFEEVGPQSFGRSGVAQPLKVSTVTQQRTKRAGDPRAQVSVLGHLLEGVQEAVEFLGPGLEEVNGGGPAEQFGCRREVQGEVVGRAAQPFWGPADGMCQAPGQPERCRARQVWGS